MIITTAAAVAGHRIGRTFGLVRGTTVRSRHVGYKWNVTWTSRLC